MGAGFYQIVLSVCLPFVGCWWWQRNNRLLIDSQHFRLIYIMTVFSGSSLDFITAFAVAFGLFSVVSFFMAFYDKKSKGFWLGLGFGLAFLCSCHLYLIGEQSDIEASRVNAARVDGLRGLEPEKWNVYSTGLRYDEPDSVAVVHVDNIHIEPNDEGDLLEVFLLDNEGFNTGMVMIADDVDFWGLMAQKEEVRIEFLDGQSYLFAQ